MMCKMIGVSKIAGRADGDERKKGVVGKGQQRYQGARLARHVVVLIGVRTKDLHSLESR
jgi:hypothetical protein